MFHIRKLVEVKFLEINSIFSKAIFIWLVFFATIPATKVVKNVQCNNDALTEMKPKPSTKIPKMKWNFWYPLIPCNTDPYVLNSWDSMPKLFALKNYWIVKVFAPPEQFRNMYLCHCSSGAANETWTKLDIQQWRIHQK